MNECRASIFLWIFFSQEIRVLGSVQRVPVCCPLSRARTEPHTDLQLNLITEAATSAQHILHQFYNGPDPLELIYDEKINLLTRQIYSIQITIDPFSTQLIKTFLEWPSTLCTLKQIISNKQVLWGLKENVNLQISDLIFILSLQHLFLHALWPRPMIPYILQHGREILPCWTGHNNTEHPVSQ